MVGAFFKFQNSKSKLLIESKTFRSRKCTEEDTELGYILKCQTRLFRIV
jgi:hypothetical protein